MAQQEFLKLLNDFRTNPSNTLVEWQRQLNHILSNLTEQGYITLPFSYTPENVANKDISGTLGTSDTKYPSQKAVKTYVDNGLSGKQNTLGYTAEDVANKSTNTALGTSDTLYSSQKAVKSYVDTGLATKQDTFTGLTQTITIPDHNGTEYHHLTFSNGVLTAYLKDTNP